MFLCLPVPDPDPPVRGIDPDPDQPPDHDPSIIMQNIDSFYFVTLFDFVSLKNDAKVPSKSKNQKNCVTK
jgi:hypothetical protein